MNKNFNETVIEYLKTYGFIISNSEIYGGITNSWDYAPIGTLLKNNIRDLWWSYFVLRDDRVFPIDSSIIINSNAWKASGHLQNFNDLLIDCKECKKRFRIDYFLTNFGYKNIESKSIDELNFLIENDIKIKCLICSARNFTQPKKFNLMFKTYQDADQTKNNELYLRPETAQNIFLNFKNIQRVMRCKLPFAIGQIGKAFRNEITTSNGIFRTKEFEQMEVEWFCYPNDALMIFEKQLEKIKIFLFNYLKLDKAKVFFKEINKNDLAHYSSKTIDIEFMFPHGQAELWGLSNRNDFDLKSHQFYSKKDLTYFDEITKKKILPYVIEPSVGLNRLLLAVVSNFYFEEKLLNNTVRIVLKLPPYLAPYLVSVLSLTKKQEKIAFLIYTKLLNYGFSVNYDISGSIGKRYRRNDAIGTPYCVTCDYNTADLDFENDTNFNINMCQITIRNRDNMIQNRVNFKELCSFLQDQKNPFLNNKKTFNK